MHRVKTFYIVIAVAIALAVAAQAETKKKATKAEIEQVLTKLSSPNPEEVINAIKALEGFGDKKAVEPICALLKTGPRNDITDAAIQALGSIADKNSVYVLLSYLEHRRVSARLAAIFALEEQSDPRINKALENALRDSDSQVRSTAALALGKRGSTGSVPVLFLAFERGVNDAAISVGQIGNPEDAMRLAGYLGKADINVLLPGFEEFLKRKDIPKQSKLAILKALFELAGPDVKRFAVAYKATFPANTDPKKDELFDLVSRMVRQIQEN